jgi:ABC-type branched-subunit amino acid transport system permease subunit
VLRLRGPYLALTTLSFAEIARVVIGNSYNFTRGDQGLNVPGLFHSRVGYYYLFLGVLVVVLAALYLLMRGRAGRFWLAIRDDEIGAESRGIDVVRYKTLAFALSCAICGLAGSLYGTFSQLVSPELGLLLQTGLVISMVVVGGMGSLTGPVVGALIVYVASEWLREAGNILVRLFHPMMPHLAEECWAALGHKTLVATESWPQLEADLLVETDITLPVQINGKKRADVTVSRNAQKAEIEAAVLALDAVKKALDGKSPKKVIVVPQRIVNVVA